MTESSLVEVIDCAKHLLEIKPDFFQLIDVLIHVLNSVKILEKIATGHLFQNYVSAGFLIVWRRIKYLLTVCVEIKHSNQVWVRVVLSA